MAKRLEGKRIAITGPRKAEELSKIVQNMGGTALIRPAQGTVFLDEPELGSGISEWIRLKPEWSVLTTGMGLEALINAAQEMELGEAFMDTLAQSKIAARGYKTANALKKRGLAPLVRDDDGSTEGLLRQMEQYDFAGGSVLVQLHGDPAPKLVDWLEGRGASVRTVLPYRHIAPPEEQLQQLLDDILERRVDAVTFTSAPQVRFLIQHAAAGGLEEALRASFDNEVVAVAVGKVTAQSIREEGIDRVIAPREERMGSMMVELAKYYAASRGEEAQSREVAQAEDTV
ncbi:uroporphyrinogen-III synthase [Saccharibacillus alkalitolerans]|uniref:Uroporphyrinogen-III synthase n=1 Tax=Saccharibacillus alkalitolerans TaxID=2705290 RepID=A0ABX0FAH3_9BACL|nr:uroporphyrinogen-III synthase [Saccharibacillus alkalitolerans]NGZ76211.1 uroporphyrinogen-III synthase [Saccharibacillus alkalitolerans]